MTARFNRSYRSSRASDATSLAIALLLAGCSKGASGGTPRDLQIPVPVHQGEAGASTDAGTPGCAPGETLPCVCADGGVGTQSCVDGGFADACNQCALVATNTGSYCVPGRYTGSFSIAKYLPEAAGCLWSIWGGNGMGDLGFTLGSPGTGAEFVTVVAAESCFDFVTTGSVDGGLAPPVPYDAAAPAPDGGATQPGSLGLEGSVDCASGKLDGILKGVYYAPVSVCGAFLGVPEQKYYSIKGRFTATFNPKTSSFDNGIIDLQEPETQAQMILPVGDYFGGKGTWHAKLDPDAPKPKPRDECYDEAHYHDFDLRP